METIECPNCKLPTIKEREVFVPTNKEPATSIEFQANSKKRYYEALANPVQSSGDIYLGTAYALRIPIQIVYCCSHCGYTKVFDLTKTSKVKN